MKHIELPTTRVSIFVELSEPMNWSRFVEIYGPPLHDWCVREGLQQADAEDLSAEILYRAIDACSEGGDTKGFDADLGPFRPWLATIARNALCDFWRRQNRQKSLGDDALADIPAPEQIERVFDDQMLVRAMQLVGESFENGRPNQVRDWEIFKSLGLSNPQPVTEVARQYELTPNHLYQIVHRIRTRIRNEYELLTSGSFTLTGDNNVS